MTMATKHEIIEEFKERYLKANKEQKSEILDHLEAVTGFKRKSIVKRMRVLQMRRSFWQDGRGRPEYYGADVTVTLREVCEKAPLSTLSTSGVDRYTLVDT